MLRSISCSIGPCGRNKADRELEVTHMAYWLFKSEPDDWSWDQHKAKGKAGEEWSGVRNYQARNNLRAMKRGDLVLFYHSVSDKQVVGLARVDKEAYVDATAKEGDWSCVDLVPVKSLAKPVTLEQIKADTALAAMSLLKQSRISVTPVDGVQFKRLLVLAETKL